MPEWYLLILLFTVISVLGPLWQPLYLAAPLALGAIVLSLVQATAGALTSSFYTAPDRGIVRIWRQCVTAYLHLLQPLARLSGRLTSGLTVWRRRGEPGFAMPRPRSSALWTENWQAPEDRLAQIKQSLDAKGAVMRRGGDCERWDFEVVGGMFGSVRMLTAIEDHGAGTQLVRMRSWPRCRNAATALAALFTILLLAAASDRAWIVVAVFGTTLTWLLLQIFLQAGQSTAALLRATGSQAEDR
jgi:hypothetical protein